MFGELAYIGNMSLQKNLKSQTLGYCCTHVETMSAKLVFTELMVVCNITAQNYVNSTNYQHF